MFGTRPSIIHLGRLNYKAWTLWMLFCSWFYLSSKCWSWSQTMTDVHKASWLKSMNQTALIFVNHFFHLPWTLHSCLFILFHRRSSFRGGKTTHYHVSSAYRMKSLSERNQLVLLHQGLCSEVMPLLSQRMLHFWLLNQWRSYRWLPLFTY